MHQQTDMVYMCTYVSNKPNKDIKQMNKVLVTLFIVIASVCILALIVSGMEQLKYERVVTAGVLGIVVMPLLLSMGRDGRKQTASINRTKSN
jgi:hypothetical protein